MPGMSLARSVVFPAPLQPASPMMRMGYLYSVLYPPLQGEGAHPARLRFAQTSDPPLQGRVKETLLGRCGGRARRRGGATAPGQFLLEPEIVVLPGPVEVDRATAHGLEGAL